MPQHFQCVTYKDTVGVPEPSLRQSGPCLSCGWFFTEWLTLIENLTTFLLESQMARSDI